MPAPLLSQARPAANPDAPVPYEFGDEIARGGMGSILEAADRRLGRTVAVKIMLSEMNTGEDRKQRFINEAAVLAQLAHPNIVPVYDIGRDSEGQLFYTMKLVHGRTLQAILQDLLKGEPMTVGHYTLDRLLTVFRKVCDALAFAHSRGIIHRDLKPENIMVGEFGEVLAMDWGLAKNLIDAPQNRSVTAAEAKPVSLDAGLDETMVSNATDSIRRAALRRISDGSNTGMTLEGEVMGTPQYMSPEQAQGRIAEMDARSDIYSLGGILYAILVLRPPVEGKTLEEVLHKVASGSISSPSAFGSGAPSGNGQVLEAKKIRPMPHIPGGRVPPALSAVAMKALTVKREARYQTVAALSADVEAYQNGFATSAEKAGAWKQFTLFVKRHKAASIGIAAVLLVGGVLGTKAFIEGQRAARALADLKQNAPAMLALAESEAVAQHFGSALEKTDATLRLDPGLLAAYWRRAWSLVALGRFSDAATALRTASERDPARARQFGIILPQIEKIAAVPGEAGRYAPDLLAPVFEFLEAHGARGEAGALIQHLRLNNDRRYAIAKEHLKALGGAVAGLGQDASGLIGLDLTAAKLNSLEQVRGIPCDVLIAEHAHVESLEPLRGLHLIRLKLGGNRISDLSPLRGMALVELNLLSYDKPALKDLSPLAGMPLRILDLFGSVEIVDLSPLHGMPLEDLDLSGTFVTDLRPLAGLPLRTLENSSVVRDLRPLAGMPLEKLSFNSTVDLTDLSPLAGLPLKELLAYAVWNIKDLTPLLRVPTLERLTLTTDPHAPPSLLAPLRQHPRLAFINYQNTGYRPVAEVWAELDAKKAGEK